MPFDNATFMFMFDRFSGQGLVILHLMIIVSAFMTVGLRHHQYQEIFACTVINTLKLLGYTQYVHFNGATAFTNNETTAQYIIMIVNMICFFQTLYLYNKFGGNGFNRVELMGRFAVGH